MSASDWTDVRERLAALAVMPDAHEVFGARSHQWRLDPPLGPADLAEVEAQLRVELPGEYRSFLSQAGAGGAGPAYGLFPLGRVAGRWQWEGDGANLTDLTALHQPFPHVEAFNLTDGLPEPPDEEDYDSVAAFNAAQDAYWERHEAVANQPEHWVGLLYLCHLGCAYREGLVVSGPARGQMWADDMAGDDGFRPLLDVDGSRMGFARWYRRWLDQATARLTAPAR